ncbi:hypothetical protein RJ641_005855 [Dillenia turbinata]|uniref:Uncharacterized protein n=1 Tax=Dillenia turbinata TaxID=194707 RepID=A0AAN8V5V1_9MAGN
MTSPLPTSTEVDSEAQNAASPMEAAAPLPLPPAMFAQRELSMGRGGPPMLNSKSKRSRSMSLSMSMKIPQGMIISKSRSVREDPNQKKKDKWKDEDSIWRKSIMLGERCRDPSNDEESILYDNEGNRIPALHKKTPSRLVSRSMSFMDRSQGQEREKDPASS